MKPPKKRMPGGDRASADQTTRDVAHCASVGVATLRAQAAAAGWRCEALPGGVIELSRWSRFRRFASIELALAFIESVSSGGRR